MSFFGLFKKKQEVKEEVKEEVKPANPNRTKILKFELKKFDVGKTTIRLKFKDKRKFDIAVYGYVDQRFYEGRDVSRLSSVVEEPRCTDPNIFSSLVVAQNFVSLIKHGEQTYKNDERQPKRVMVGCVVEATIISTEIHEDTFNVASVVPIFSTSSPQTSPVLTEYYP